MARVLRDLELLRHCCVCCCVSCRLASITSPSLSLSSLLSTAFFIPGAFSTVNIPALSCFIISSRFPAEIPFYRIVKLPTWLLRAAAAAAIATGLFCISFYLMFFLGIVLYIIYIFLLFSGRLLSVV